MKKTHEKGNSWRYDSVTFYRYLETARVAGCLILLDLNIVFICHFRWVQFGVALHLNLIGVKWSYGISHVIRVWAWGHYPWSNKRFVVLLNTYIKFWTLFHFNFHLSYQYAYNKIYIWSTQYFKVYNKLIYACEM